MLWVWLPNAQALGSLKCPRPPPPEPQAELPLLLLVVGEDSGGGLGGLTCLPVVGQALAGMQADLTVGLGSCAQARAAQHDAQGPQ